MQKIGNRIGYLGLLFLTAVWFVFLHHYMIFLCLLLLCIAPVFSMLAVYDAFKKVNVSLEEKPLPFGKEASIPVALFIDNPTIFPLLFCELKVEIIHYFYEKTESISLNVPIRAKRKQKVNIPIAILYSGCVQVSIKEIVVMDWFSLKNYHRTLDVIKEYIVLPMQEGVLEHLKKVGGIGAEAHVESNGKGENFSEITEIREYQPGDRLQKIHWKLSAKKEILMVKEYDSMSAKEITILFELYLGEENTLDLIIDALYMFAEELLEQKENFFLRWWSEKNGEIEQEKIESQEDLLLGMHRIFYEKPYLEKNKAYYMDREKENKMGIRYYVEGLEKNETAKGEELLRYKNRVAITELGKEI